MSSIYDWSLQAANNANADDIINWVEGQPPSTVNNSARAMMQRIKEFITDIGGAATVQGTPNVLSVFAKSPFNKYVDGIRINLRAIGTNTGAATLNVNAVGSKSIYCIGLAGVAPVGAGQIQAGGVYDFVYCSALADNAGGWFMLNPTQTQTVPAGLIFMVAAPIVPADCLYCNGQAVSRTTYARLFGVIGNRWGAGDGSTTFNLPDLRGVFPRGWDDGRGVDPGRVFASYQGSQNLAHGHSFSGWTSGAGGHDHDVGARECGYGAAVRITRAMSSWTADSPNRTSWVGDHSHSFSGTTNGDGGNEARPVNNAVYFVIKT
ncbi:phage tail protein [Brucella anthropi]|uniref:phage tail protein n=1 Tax=Brucella anthropi TaxID=529 RepID=UPI002362CC0B|nr:phage tail protein [Brucella anthropi]